jgi:hypothetical protein
MRNSSFIVARGARCLALALIVAGTMGMIGCGNSNPQPFSDALFGNDVPMQHDLPPVLDLPRMQGHDLPSGSDLPGVDAPVGVDQPQPVDQGTGQDAGPDVAIDTAGTDVLTGDAPGPDVAPDLAPPADAVNVGTVMIQDVQDGTVAHGDTVTLAMKIVTGVSVNSRGTTNLYIQEPQGQTTAGHTYPEFAGVNVFFLATEAPNFPDLQGLALGDCISVSGTLGEFPSNPSADVGTTEIATPTAFSKQTGCGAAPTPFVVNFADIATTSNVAGPKAETYEGVLVTLQNVQVTGTAAANGKNFTVSTNGTTTSTVTIDSFLLGGGNFSFPAHQSFSSITGVLSQINTGTTGQCAPAPAQCMVVYRISPRSSSELVTN